MNQSVNKSLRTQLLLLVLLLMTSGFCHAQYRSGMGVDDVVRGELTANASLSDDASSSTVTPPGIRYTRDHPFIVAADWTFPPYSFVNDEGKPDGLLIDIITEVFQRLHIAYEIRMMDYITAHRQLMEGTVNLMIDIDSIPLLSNVKSGNTVVAPYNVAVLKLENTPMMRSITLLSKLDTVVMCKDNYPYYYMHEFFPDSVPFTMEVADYSVAINRLVEGSVRYFIWNEVSLRYIMDKYSVGNMMRIERVDVPEGHMRFFCTDTLMLKRLDRILASMQATGQYDRIYNKWLAGGVPADRDISTHVVLFALLTLSIIVLFYIILHHTVPSRLKNEFTNISKAAVDMTGTQILVFNVRNNKVQNFSGDFLPPEGLSVDEYMTLIHPDDVDKIIQLRNDIDSGVYNHPVINFRMRRYNDPGMWHHVVANATMKVCRGKLQYVYIVINDETEHIEKHRKLSQLLNEYSIITDMSDFGRAYYDEHGHLLKCNTLFYNFFDKGGIGRGRDFIDGITLGELCLQLNSVVLEKNMDMWFCAPVDIPELNLKQCCEVKIRTVWDDCSVCRGYVVTLVDSHDAIQLRKELKDVEHEIKKINRRIKLYTDQFSFIMRNNGICTFNWEKGGDSLTLYDTYLNKKVLSYEQYVKELVEEDRVAILAALREPEKYVTEPIHVVRNIRKTDGKNTDRWYDVYIMPEYDSQGRYVGVFGIRIDITEDIRTEQKLKERLTNNPVKQKVEFLASMTHELRTPLNAINGFAEIISFLTTDEEKKQYVDIMADNCNTLISLVDNILQISTIDTEGMKLRNTSVDFVVAFRKKAEKLRKYITVPEVEYKVDIPLSTLNINIDVQRVMQVLDIFVNNAAKFTKKGTIHVGFNYIDTHLTVYCKDTGCGISPDIKKKVFQRFYKIDEFTPGTGLGLPLAKIIADKMGAKIKLRSKLGEGTSISFCIDTETLVGGEILQRRG